jgi:hypothetical protein
MDTKFDTPELAEAAAIKHSWIDAKTKPTGGERTVLVWVVWPQCGWPQWPEPLIGWWKPGPGCFAVGNVENANHLVTHWMDISEPNTNVGAPDTSVA